MTKKQIAGWIVAITGQSVETVALQHGYSKAAFYDVMRQRTKTPHLRNLIAELIGKPEAEIWPPQASEQGTKTDYSNRNQQKANN